jgi:crossover junction endodeoxyribonuclease RuvC
MPPVAQRVPSATAKKLRVLGVDPAFAGATGYGIVEWEGRTARLLDFGALKLPARMEFGTRLRDIYVLMAGLLEKYSPDAIAVESVFTALNVRTALKLAEVRGVVLLAAEQAGIPAHSYSPREVKASVAGYGAASKLQMQQMVRVLLNLREIPEPSDAADALAVALCHAQLAQTRDRLAISLQTVNASAVAIIATGGAANGASGLLKKCRIAREPHSRPRAARIKIPS